MGKVEKEVFVCLDCETTGLDPKKDHIIEVAAAVFDLSKIHEQYETLIDPKVEISKESIEIHHITQDMVTGKPEIREVLRDFFKLVGNRIIVGHGIGFDIEILQEAARRESIPWNRPEGRVIDTLRLARLYGESPTNSLETLRRHFNIEAEIAHRAMGDAVVNIEVFKRLITKFPTTESIFKRLSHPILLKEMPLGKHKGRPFKEIPQNYLHWALNKDFDQDLIFSIRNELKRRKQGNQFYQSGNPFQDL